MQRIFLCLALILAATVGTPVYAGTPGKALFDKECAACHGIDGAGRTELGKRLKPFPARDLRPKILSMQEIRSVLEQGRSKTSMHGHGKRLNQQQIGVLTAYVQSLPYRADRQNGQARYQQLCARCHGADAQGLAEMASPNLVLSELPDIQMAKIIREGHPGTIMGGMKQELGNADIADIIVWLRLQRYGLQ